MTTDDLRTRAKEAAALAIPADDVVETIAKLPQRAAFIAGALWHAAQQPTREQIARAIHPRAWDNTPVGWSEYTVRRNREISLEKADAVLALLDGAGS